LGSNSLKKRVISFVSKLSRSLKDVVNSSICNLSLAILFLFNPANVLNYKLAKKLIYCQLLEFCEHREDFTLLFFRVGFEYWEKINV